MKKVKLPSGRELEIGDTPFSESKALFEAVAEEMESISINDGSMAVPNIMKNVLARICYSKRISKALEPCLLRVVVDKVKIGEQTFEKKEHRADYLEVVYEVATENLDPFMQSLFAKYRLLLGLLEKAQA